MNITNKLVFLFLLDIFTCLETINKTLKMVHLVYRHGARSPISFYPTNVYSTYWLDGPGILTVNGMNMEYDLGKFLKKRYMEENKLLNTSYIHQQVYIRSTSVARCLQSAETQLTGLYPPKGHQIWNTAIPWQPIPIYSVPIEEDMLLRPDEPSTCPRLKEMWDAKTREDVYIQKEKDNKDFLAMLSNNTGMTVNFDNMWIINDDLKCEAAENLTSPSWINNDERNHLENLSDWIFLNKYQGDDELSKLLGGTLLKTIIDDMKKFIQGTDKDELHEVTLYSGHDTSLLSLSTALNIYLMVAPPFASCMMVELYKNDAGEYFVQLMYRNDSSGKAYPLKLNSCEEACPFNTFVDLLQNRIADQKDRLQNCGISNSSFFTTDRLKIISIIFFVLTILFLIVIITLLVRKHRLRNRMFAHQYEADKLINT